MLATVVSVHIYYCGSPSRDCIAGHLAFSHMLCLQTVPYGSGGYVPSRGSLPTHVTHSVAGDLGALDFQVFSAPVCTTVSVDCDPN